MKTIKLFLLSMLAGHCAISAIPDSNAVNRISLSTDLVLDVVKEYNLSAEYQFRPRLATGMTLSLIKPCASLEVYQLSPSQDKYPGKVYEGFSTRAYLKWYRQKVPSRYWELMFVYRNISYDSIHFVDMKYKDVYYYSRNERSSVYGLDLIYGIELGKHRRKIFFSDLYFGLGYRIRQRSYTTYESTLSRYNYQPYTPIPAGHFSIIQQYPVLILGFKTGGSIHNKKAR